VPLAQRITEETLAPLSAKEAATLVKLLGKLA
jgi:MarR family transcriptional regulator, lower aerobic nicotinate degradation pathway regulator